MIIVKEEPKQDYHLYQSPQLGDHKRSGSQTVLNTDNIVPTTTYRNLEKELKYEEPVTAPSRQEEPV